MKTPGPLLIDDCQAWPRVGVKEEDKEHESGEEGGTGDCFWGRSVAIAPSK